MTKYYIQYDHHGKQVWVREALKGTHREHNLCYTCVKLKPGEPDNCKIAEAILKNCKEFHIVTPTYECPAFEEAPTWRKPFVEQKKVESNVRITIWNINKRDYQTVELVKIEGNMATVKDLDGNQFEVAEQNVDPVDRADYNQFRADQEQAVE